MQAPSALLTGLLALTLTALGACDRRSASESESKPEPKPEPKSAPTCDQAKLADLAERLRAAEPEQRLALVSEGLLGACDGALSATAEYVLAEVARPDPKRRLSLAEDKPFAAARERICPNHAELHERLAKAAPHDQAMIVYEVCGLARYDLLEESQLRGAGPFAGWVTWTTHEQLLAQGTPVEVAKTISRAVFSVELHGSDSVLIRRPPDQTLVAADVTTPIPSGALVQLSATELMFDERLIAPLDAGKLRPEHVERHLVVPLFEVLEEEAEKTKLVHEARGEEWDGTLVVSTDRRVTFGTLVDTLYTAGRLGFLRFAFVVERTHPILRAILVTPPKFEDGAVEPAFKVFIADDGYVVLDQAGQPVKLARLDQNDTGSSSWDQAKLVEAARAAVAANPKIIRAVVSAENHIAAEVLLATYAALLGPGCNQVERTNCLLPELTIDAGTG
jgi:hypothetical protein